MLKISGCELDLEQSSDGTDDLQWRLVFTKGQFIAPGVAKTTEPVQFVLKRSNYNLNVPKGYYIYFNPENNKYNIIENDKIDLCNNPGYNIGGFLVRNCKLSFIYPKCSDDVEYKRPFAEEFTRSYEKREMKCSDYEGLCGAFNDVNFSDEEFETHCPIIEDNNAFYYAEFDNEEFETEIP